MAESKDGTPPENLPFSETDVESEKAGKVHLHSNKG
jgi:hypothetical protein